MPFCTVCGTQNPDDARFCAQCGNRLQSAAPAGESDPSGESTATISISAADKAETSDRQLNPVDAAAVDALPSGHALLVVQRGPGAGSRFLLDQDVVSCRSAPRQRDLPRRRDGVAAARGVPPRRRLLHGQRRRQPQRHLRQPRPDRPGPARPTGTRCRSASSGWSSSRGTRTGERQPIEQCRRLGRRPGPVPGADEHRGGPRPAAPGLPRASRSRRSGSSRTRA